MMIKYRVREVAKDLNIQNKDVINVLAKYFEEPKKYMNALNEEELDVVFDTFTQKRNMESLDAYFAERETPAAEPEPEEPAAPAEEKAKPAAAEKKNSAAV